MGEYEYECVREDAGGKEVSRRGPASNKEPISSIVERCRKGSLPLGCGRDFRELFGLLSNQRLGRPILDFARLRPIVDRPRPCG
eukprot:2753044-Pyramimonas_sp.AAC.1